MKTVKHFVVLLIFSLSIGSCGSHYGNTLNLNNNVTNIELSKKNFVVVDKLSASSEASYIMGIGGISEKSMIENAKAKIYKKADIVGSSKAITNLCVEEHTTNILFPIYYKKTITVSALVVEFYE